MIQTHIRRVLLLKKWIKWALLSLILLIPASTVCANTLSNVNASIDNNKLVTISGVVSAGRGQTVMVKIVDPNDILEYAGNVLSTNSGNFILTYTMNNTMYGTYKVSVNAYDVTSPVSTTFTYGSNCNLSSLEINSGSFDKDFSYSITDYKVEVLDTISRIRVTPTASESSSTVTVNGTAVKSGSSTESIALKEGDNLIKVMVTALSGKSQTYTINVTRKKAVIPTLTATASINSDNMVTVSGNISSGSGQPVSVLIKDPKNNIEYTNDIFSSTGGNFQISYSLINKNTGKYTVIVSCFGASAPITTYFYYITEVGLNSLSISNITLSPAFSSSVTAYTATADGSFDSITITPVAVEGTAKIIVNKMAIKSGDTTSPIRLKDGMNTIKIDLIGLNETLTKTYTISIDKKVLSPVVTANADISKKKVVTVKGNIGLKSTRFVSVMVMDPDGKLDYVNNTTSKVDGSYQFDYTLSSSTKGTYKVYVATLGIQKPVVTQFNYNPIVELSGLALENAAFTPGFSSMVTEYNSTVEFGTTYVKVIPTAVDVKAEITINGEKVASGKSSSIISLAEGSNRIAVVVTSFDLTKTYYIDVLRKARPLSANADLNSLVLGQNAALSPVFSAAVTSYTASVANNISFITVTPATADSNAAVKVNNASVNSCSVSNNIALAVGSGNIITVAVTAENGTIKTYTINVTRALSSACDVTAVTAPAQASINGITITASVSNNTSSVNVDVSISANASWKLYSDAACTVLNEIVNKQMTLNVGANTAYIKITGQDGASTKIYTLTIKRLSSDATLSNLSVMQTIVEGLEIDLIQFSVAFTEYDIFLQGLNKQPYDGYIIPTASNLGATIAVTLSDGQNVTVLNAVNGSYPVGPLDSNSDYILTITVSAEDGTTKVYHINFK